MSIEIWLAIIAIVATPVGGAIGAVLMRGKYRVEIESLRTDIDRKVSEVATNELQNVRVGNDILMTQIVEPLKIEIKYLRTDVNRFRKAIEKIPACPHSDQCPVSAQLQSDEKDAARQSEDYDRHGAVRAERAE